MTAINRHKGFRWLLLLIFIQALGVIPVFTIIVDDWAECRCYTSQSYLAAVYMLNATAIFIIGSKNQHII